MKGIDKKDLDMIWEWFSKSDLTSATIECDETGAFKIELSRASEKMVQSLPHAVGMVVPPAESPAVEVHAPASIQPADIMPNTAYKEVKAPIVGTFYRSSNPDAPAFVQVGDKIQKGQTICIIEAMKVMNEFEADFDMEIVDVLVENATLVEYEQTLFRVLPL